MRRESLLFDEIIGASQRAHDIASRHSVEELATSLDARDALLWNLTVVGEAVGQIPDALRAQHPDVPGPSPFDCGIASCTVTGRWTSTSSTRLPSPTFQASLSRSALSLASCRLRPLGTCS